MSIGERMRLIRQNHGQNQEQVAEILGVSRQTISNRETGRTIPSMDALIRFTRLYDLSLDAFIGRETTPSKGRWRKYGYFSLFSLLLLAFSGDSLTGLYGLVFLVFFLLLLTDCFKSMKRR